MTARIRHGLFPGIFTNTKVDYFKKQPPEVSSKKGVLNCFAKIHRTLKEHFYIEHQRASVPAFFDSEYSKRSLVLHHPVNRSFQIGHDICFADKDTKFYYYAGKVFSLGTSIFDRSKNDLFILLRFFLFNRPRWQI